MKQIFIIISLVATVIWISEEARSPWLVVVFIASSIVKYDFNRFFIEPMTKGSNDKYAWFYRHARAWATGDHPQRSPLKCDLPHEKTP